MTVKVCLEPPLNPGNQTRFTDTAVTLVRVRSMTGASGAPTNEENSSSVYQDNKYFVNFYSNPRLAEPVSAYFSTEQIFVFLFNILLRCLHIIYLVTFGVN